MMPSLKSKLKQNLRASLNTFKFEAIGTHWTIDLKSEHTKETADLLYNKILKRIDEFDKNYSRFREDSLVFKMFRNPGIYTLPDDAKKILDLYQELYKLTDGLVTPLIGNTLVEAGYDAKYSFQQKDIHPVSNWIETLDYNYPQLTIKKPAILDFGALGKGYLIDIIGQLLADHGISEFCIDAGGDILYFDETESLRVGLENPVNTSQVIGVAKIKNQSICGSAGNRRNWGQFHHIINPQTLNSVKDILAVWVIADTAILADGLSTALFFISPERLATEFSFDYLILNADFSIQKSSTFTAELFMG